MNNKGISGFGAFIVDFDFSPYSSVSLLTLSK